MRNFIFNVQEFFKEKWRKFKKFFKSFAVKFVERHEKIKSKYNIGRIFKQQEKFRNKIYKDSCNKSYINWIYGFSGLAIIILAILFLAQPKINFGFWFRFTLSLLFVAFFFNIISFTISDLKYIFDSVFKFTFRGTSTFFIGSFCIFSILFIFTEKIKFSYYFAVVIMVPLWSYLSTLDDLEVAKIGNGIISAFVTLGLEFTGNLRGSIVFNDSAIGNLADPNFMNKIKIDENIWKILLFPFVAATLIGLISCEYKEYWIKRNGKSKEIYTRYE